MAKNAITCLLQNLCRTCVQSSLLHCTKTYTDTQKGITLGVQNPPPRICPRGLSLQCFASFLLSSFCSLSHFLLPFSNVSFKQLSCLSEGDENQRRDEKKKECRGKNKMEEPYVFFPPSSADFHQRNTRQFLLLTDIHKDTHASTYAQILSISDKERE